MDRRDTVFGIIATMPGADRSSHSRLSMPVRAQAYDQQTLDAYLGTTPPVSPPSPPAQQQSPVRDEAVPFWIHEVQWRRRAFGWTAADLGTRLWGDATGAAAMVLIERGETPLRTQREDIEWALEMT